MTKAWSMARKMAEQGIAVVPIRSKEKGCKLKNWPELASIDIGQIERWANAEPEGNYGVVASPTTVVILDADNPGLSSDIERATGNDFPNTLTVKSSKGYHYYFKQTEKTRTLGNRKVREMFDLQSNRKYVVGPGSIHPSGAEYTIVNKVEIAPMPDWLAEHLDHWSATGSAMHGTRPACVMTGRPPVGGGSNAHVDQAQLHEDFDFHDFCEFFEISGHDEKDSWFICDECPVAGYRHSQSTKTGFFYDGDHLGFHCFASDCDGSSMTVGQVISYLNREKGEPYKGVIWDTEEDDEGIVGKWDVDFLEDDDTSATPKVEVKPHILTLAEVRALIDAESSSSAKAKAEIAVVSRPAEEAEYDYTQHGDKPAGDLKWDGTLPMPSNLAITDPEGLVGLDFPGDCAMYGKLKEIAKRSPALQLGWFYPALLGVACAIDIEDARQDQWRVRGNMYIALLGAVGSGKNVHMDAAKAALFVPNSETVYVEDTPGSHGGLMNQLSDEEPLPRLLFLDELVSLFNACAITGSNLPAMLCTLWNKDTTGNTVRKSREVVYGKLSILGGVAVNDTADFSRIFGANTVKGMYDRFLFGYSKTSVKFKRKNLPSYAERIDVKPVHFADWVYEAKDNWIGDDVLRSRMSEHVLRVAMVTAALNGDKEITKNCLEAAFRFMEWQLRLRGIFKPGLAETKEAECYEAVYSALRERHDQQRLSMTMPKGADRLSIDMPKESRWKLIHFTKVVNSKSYYRRYAGLIDRVKKSMIDNDVIWEVKEEDDENGKSKKSKTPFIIITSDLK